MDRDRAYAKLVEELERWRRLPFVDLVSLVDAPPLTNTVPVGSEIIDVEVRVRWAESGPGAVRVEAVANGPSCWRLERLEEAITVSASQISRDRHLSNSA